MSSSFGVSVSRHTADTDAGDLARRIEAEQQAGGVAAREDKSKSDRGV